LRERVDRRRACASADALGEGFVESLARPGGNVTGVSFLAGPEIAGKQLELLKEIVPAATRVAARKLRVQLVILDARVPADLERAFAASAEARAEALLVLTDSMFFGQRRAFAGLAARGRLPALYSQREFVDAGGLASYGPSIAEMFRRAATYVDRILRGANARELPVEQPTKFELVINLATARSLGLAISQPVLLRADDVIT